MLEIGLPLYSTTIEQVRRMKTMKKLAVVTTTRADYGLLHPVIKGFRKLEDEAFKLILIVTGTH